MFKRAIALLAVSVVVLGCQNYNFSPINKCLVQPASKRITLEDVTTADILFVVDDSASMTTKQSALANSFSTFITSLNQSNTDRVNRGLQPYDFHIAVTTSSIYFADPHYTYSGSQIHPVPNPTNCILNGGQTQCCGVNSASCSAVPYCTPGDTCGTGGKCVFARSAIGNTYPPVTYAYQCCTDVQTSCTPSSCFPGDFCPVMTTTYAVPGPNPDIVCQSAIFHDGDAYPAGNFVAVPGNAVVLHFTKDLYTPTLNTATITNLSNQFMQNIVVGNCGSPQEQHFEAARVAIQKALGGQYKSDFPHQGAKLIVVWVGDEDDCSSPGPGASNSDQSKSIILDHQGSTGADECVADKNVAQQMQGQKVPQGQQISQRAFPVGDYYSYFTSLVAPEGQKTTATQPYRAFSAAFITGTVPCVDGAGSTTPVSYTPADGYLFPECAGSSTPQYQVNTTSCPWQNLISGAPGSNISGGIWAAGVRFSALANMLGNASYSVVQDTVCDSLSQSGFGTVLSQIANLVTSPTALTLPTEPATGEVAFLEIIDSNGNPLKICTQATTQDQTATAGWWFTSCGQQSSAAPPIAVDSSGNAIATQCIYINHASSSCEASPGQTYEAAYLGMVPASGCTSPSLDTTVASQSCATLLGGQAKNWACLGQPAANVGTCICSGK